MTATAPPDHAAPRLPIVYGVPFSQPVRAVTWLLLNRGLPFEPVLVIPGSPGRNGSRHPDFLAKNPAGTVPVYEEPDTGTVIAEAHAIMAYLCNRHGWHDLYPVQPERRARVDWYLNYHHRNVREASVGLVAPRIRKDLAIPEATRQAALATFRRALEAIEQGWLARSAFLAGDTPTLADIAACVDIGQLQPRYTRLFDFDPYPRVRAWLETMTTVDGHDEVHVPLVVLGDVSAEPPTMEAIREANLRGLEAVRARLARKVST
jgi:glutathione S-transferase